MSKHFVTGNSFQSLLPYFTRSINEKTSWPRNVENFTRVYFVFFSSKYAIYQGEHLDNLLSV